VATIFGKGKMRTKATAAKNTPRPFTTQQIAVDNSLIASMRSVVGSLKNRGSAVRPS